MGKEHNLGIEDKDYDRIMQLLQSGKEKSGLLDEEVGELMPSEAGAQPDEFDRSEERRVGKECRL